MSEYNFLLISDPRIWALPVQECHEKLVDVRDFDFVISSQRASFYSGYTKVRESVVNKLLLASQLLPQGLRWYFSEGHRPISLQASMYSDYYNSLAKANPHWDKQQLEIETVKYIAPPLDVPPHSTGGAIDLTLIDTADNELDMGSILDETPDKNANRNFTHAANISATAQANRKIMIAALSSVGFVNYPAEWWHWSFGDKYWAYHSGHAHALYHSIE